MAVWKTINRLVEMAMGEITVLVPFGMSTFFVEKCLLVFLRGLQWKTLCCEFRYCFKRERNSSWGLTSLYHRKVFILCVFFYLLMIFRFEFFWICNNEVEGKTFWQRRSAKTSIYFSLLLRAHKCYFKNLSKFIGIQSRVVLSDSCRPKTAQKMKFSIKDFFNKCDQIRRKLKSDSLLLGIDNFFRIDISQNSFRSTDFFVPCFSLLGPNALNDNLRKWSKTWKQFVGNVFECVWPFCGVDAWRITKLRKIHTGQIIQG